MKLEVKHDMGYAEIALFEQASLSNFQRAVAILADQLKLPFIGKAQEEEDAVYRNFKFKKALLTIYCNIYHGISIFPENKSKASSKDNSAISHLAEKMESVLLAHGGTGLAG